VGPAASTGSVSVIVLDEPLAGVDPERFRLVADRIE
jgi:ABC-type multidrug transport system ATPase subunit